MSLLRSFLLLAVAATSSVVPAGAGDPEAVWLTADDGVEVRGDLFAAEGDDGSAPVVLLFHQAGSNRGEYGPIAPRLRDMGFTALAIDQRSGGKRWEHANLTVQKNGGESTTFLAALADLEAALEWAHDGRSPKSVVVWGSSYSASLVFLLAQKHSDRIDGILSFSPGEYLATRREEVRTAAREVSHPTLIVTPAGERERAEGIHDALASEDKQLVIPRQSRHGSSMLVSDRNAGAEDIWPGVEEFLKRFR
jgi:dienelactone hydrolase